MVLYYSNSRKPTQLVTQLSEISLFIPKIQVVTSAVILSVVPGPAVATSLGKL